MKIESGKLDIRDMPSIPRKSATYIFQPLSSICYQNAIGT